MRVHFQALDVVQHAAGFCYGKYHGRQIIRVINWSIPKFVHLMCAQGITRDIKDHVALLLSCELE